MRNSLAICVVFTICSGQACIPSGSASIPTPPQLGSVISEGIYSGSANVTYVSKINTTVIEEFRELLTFDVAFGPNGFPLNTRNEPIQIGDILTVNTGGLPVTMVVVGVISVSNGIQVSYDTYYHYISGQEVFFLEGPWTETYVRVDDRTLDVSLWNSVGHLTHDGDLITVTASGRGRLTR